MIRLNAGRVLRPLALVLGLTAAQGALSAASAEPITIMVVGMEKQIYLPAVLTQQLGFFKEAGVEVGARCGDGVLRADPGPSSA